MRRIPGLDGLRAIAVTLVILHHCLPSFAGGRFGVGIFFVLSGFLITSLLVQERERTGTVARGRFYARRALRLYPALLVMLVVTQALITTDVPSAFVAATYTTDLVIAYGHRGVSMYNSTWTLALEEQFYLLWPLLLPFVLRLRRRTAAGLLLAAAAASCAWWAQAPETLGGVYDPISNAHGLLLGCALALTAPRLTGLTNVPWRAVGLGGALTIAASVAGQSLLDHRDAIALATFAGELGCAALILSLARPGGARTLVGGALTLAPVAWLGVRSYAVYLWHQPLIWAAHVHHLGPGWGALASVGAAALSWRLVETPFLRLKDRFAAPRAPEPAAPADALTTTYSPLTAATARGS